MTRCLIEHWLCLPRNKVLLSVVKTWLAVALALIAATCAHAQEAELPEVVVTGTFELRRGPSVTDLFTLHLLKQDEAKRGLEEMTARAPWYYSSFWKYFCYRN